MKSITIHKIDDETEKRLAELAAKEGVSLNRLIKRILRESLGIEKKSRNNKSDFSEFCGIWSQEDYEEFKHKTASLEEISEEDWQ
ncbi:MAG: ribbon-helix-helix protein, CopG family [Candidatus Dadabacteria bacterium]|nr:ribbon-helix-helix protein, CopG family [Candidatus Dadabacteria bacterium]